MTRTKYVNIFGEIVGVCKLVDGYYYILYQDLCNNDIYVNSYTQGYDSFMECQKELDKNAREQLYKIYKKGMKIEHHD